ncbi:MAG: hypothetical protein WAN49_09310, partial [Pseudolabrys sp.]
REASALRAVVVLAATFPGEPQSQFRALVRRHIEQTATQEWPMMARGTATLRFTTTLVAEALQLTLALTSNSGHSATMANLINSLSDHTRHQTPGHSVYV